MKRLHGYIRREYRSFGYAVKGLAAFFRSGAHARFHTVAAGLVLFLCILLPLTRTELLLIVLNITVVLITEVLNTCLEHLLDIVHKQHHPQVGRVKDMAAGAVLLAAICSAVTGAVIFIPKILTL